MFPGNHPPIRAAQPRDANVLRALAAAASTSPLRDPIYLAELHGEVVAAISGDDHRTVADREAAPAYYVARLRLHLAGIEAYAREPRLSERMRAAVLGPRPAEELPLAA